MSQDTIYRQAAIDAIEQHKTAVLGGRANGTKEIGTARTGKGGKNEL